MSALNAVDTAISDLDEEGYPVDDLRETREAFAELIEAADQVNALSIQSDAHRRLRAARRRVKGGAA